MPNQRTFLLQPSSISWQRCVDPGTRLCWLLSISWRVMIAPCNYNVLVWLAHTSRVPGRHLPGAPHLKNIGCQSKGLDSTSTNQTMNWRFNTTATGLSNKRLLWERKRWLGRQYSPKSTRGSIRRSSWVVAETSTCHRWHYIDSYQITFLREQELQWREESIRKAEMKKKAESTEAKEAETRRKRKDKLQYEKVERKYKDRLEAAQEREKEKPHKSVENLNLLN